LWHCGRCKHKRRDDRREERARQASLGQCHNGTGGCGGHWFAIHSPHTARESGRAFDLHVSENDTQITEQTKQVTKKRRKEKKKNKRKEKKKKKKKKESKKEKKSQEYQQYERKYQVMRAYLHHAVEVD
jgi:hypothetical protein